MKSLLKSLSTFRELYAIAGIALIVLFAGAAMAQTKIGSVDTAWNLTKNDTIEVERYDDPRVKGASCYVSYAKKGGVTGMIGFAENPSNFSIACRATGPITIEGQLPAKEEIVNKSQSILFKELHITRMIDKQKNVLIYLVWSDRLIDGSPFNSVTAIPLQ